MFLHNMQRSVFLSALLLEPSFTLLDPVAKLPAATDLSGSSFLLYSLTLAIVTRLQAILASFFQNRCRKLRMEVKLTHTQAFFYSSLVLLYSSSGLLLDSDDSWQRFD